ncbi:MAG: alcohol dehydrogenase [Candidatus Omnitrophica bacterium]|nr:alcohol dehydrogenase [Candidatus Omnitrophota bacterium]
MPDWKKALVASGASIADAIAKIDAGSIQIAFVVDAMNKLCGTVTDGDVRRGMLKGVPLSAPVESIMRHNPAVLAMSDDPILARETMQKREIHQLPILNSEGQIIDVKIIDELLKVDPVHNWIILMAGGLGTRLRPLTDDCPKPLLSVGNKPILETILQNFIEQGFHRFFISVHYKDEMVRHYFGNGSKWGADITYLHEHERRGTAGALALLPETPKQTFIVMNGDLLTKINFRQLLQFHREHEALGTMCVREYDFQVPFGVVQLDRQRIQAIDEKPIHKFFVNAGIYAFEPDAISLIPQNEYFDMPNLFEILIQNKKETAAFPLREYWLDVGRVEDLVRANGEFAEIFKAPAPSVKD